MLEYINDSIKLTKDNIISIVERRKKELESVCKLLEKNIEKAPEGCLRVSVSNGKAQYYYKENSKKSSRKYIPKSDKKLAYLLAQKDYNRKLLVALSKELDVMKWICSHYHPEKIQEIYDKTPISRKILITPITLSDDEYIKCWEAQEYEHMGFKENMPEYYTARGERVRSKSEIMIADTLYRRGIPYRYEYPIRLQGIGTVHADFYCLNVRTRKEFVWEHFGMMDNDVYSNGAVGKIEKYTLNDYWPGMNFIATFESAMHPLSTKFIEVNIQKYLT